MYTAHINSYGHKQNVESHLEGTCKRAEQYTKNLNLTNISKLQALLHDAGKFCSDFDNYINGNSKLRRGDIDHSYAGAKYISETADMLDKKYYNISRFIAHTVISHHGLHDWYDSDGADYLKRRTQNSKNYTEILDAFSKMLHENEFNRLIEYADSEYNFIKKEINELCQNSNKSRKRAFYLGMFERLMQSVLIDADRTDTVDFMSEKTTEKIYNDDELKDVWKEMHNNLENKLSKYSKYTDKISVQRRKISERCREFAKNDVKICRLIVPTGGGKTLSSLRFAVEYCINHNKEKIFYIAPYMSILEQNSAEINSVVSKEHFIEHHSNALNEIRNSGELEEYELRTEKWDLPVIATTMVQFLNSLFSGKSSAVRRMHRLANSVIIIDEVQSVPLKCMNLFNLAMNFLANICQCTIILCSATQPVFENTNYPMFIDEKESMTGDYSEDFKVFERTKIIPQIEKYGMNYDETAEFCRKKYEKAGNLLVIVNTKKSAETLYKKMKETSYSVKPEIIHLSTNMCPAHRKEKIEYIRNNLDKPLICITTQLIEAGVDISFNCVVRSLAGLDNAVQAAGRCNRHGENPEICPVYIIDINEEKLDKLYDIQRAKNISLAVISSYKDCDYTSPEMLKVYYDALLNYAKDELDYNDKKNNDTLLNYLSLNDNRHNSSINKDYNKQNQYMAQAFKTAGDIFDVIDAATEGVIVPYNEEAIDIINQLQSDIKPDIAINLLRSAQKYTVAVYPNLIYALRENYALICIDTINILKSEFYDNEIGINIKGENMDFLAY